MKFTLSLFTMIFMMNVYAETKATRLSDSEIAQNRACFQDLEVQGCRSQDEDPEQFRACLANSHQSLDEHCKKMMLDLYGDRD